MQTSMETNPLLEPSFRIAFDRVRAAEIEPAIARLLEDARAAQRAIGDRPGGRTFANTMKPLDDLTEHLDFAMAVVKHLESVATYPELRAALNAVQPPVSAFYAGIPLDDRLWQAVKTYAASAEAQSLTGARR